MASTTKNKNESKQQLAGGCCGGGGAASVSERKEQSPVESASSSWDESDADSEVELSGTSPKYKKAEQVSAVTRVKKSGKLAVLPKPKDTEEYLSTDEPQDSARHRHRRHGSRRRGRRSRSRSRRSKHRRH